jgi:predicted Zn finger-like uncharacterized protein
MVIQCTSCHTKYRLNLERIPNRKTFVKCRNCGTPIYIDPPADAAAESMPESPRPRDAAVPRPTEETAGRDSEPRSPQSVIACPNCATRYRVPDETLSRPRVRLKCTQCGHEFAAGAPAAAPAPSRDLATRAGRDFFPDAQGEPEEREGGLQRPMPIPDESTLEGMFDDLRDKASPFAAKPAAPPAESAPPSRPHAELTPQEQARGGAAPPGKPEPGMAAEAEERATKPAPEPPRQAGMLHSADLDRLGGQARQAVTGSRPHTAESDPERAYLEAVALDDEDLPVRPKGRGTVPDEYKYRFFLKPGAASESPAAVGQSASSASPAGPPAAKPPPTAAPEPELEGAESIPGAGDEELFPPPPSPVLEAEGADLDAMASALNEEALRGESRDEVDALLMEHGLGEEPALPQAPTVHADPRLLAVTAPPPLMPEEHPAWHGRLLAAGVLLLAAAVLVLAFLVGYMLG